MLVLEPPKKRPSTKATDFLALERLKAAAEPAGPLPITIYSKSYFFPILYYFITIFINIRQIGMIFFQFFRN